MTNPFGVKMIEIKDMFSCGVHYGHRSCYANSQMKQYVYTQKNDLQIIDLTKTAVLFAEALTFVDQLVRSGGRIVVVSTKQSAQDLVNKYGSEMEMPYVDQRWYGGTLTNFKTIRSSVVDRLGALDKRFQAGDFKGLTKKERLILQRERAKLTSSLGGIKEMNTLPEALFVIDVSQEKIAIKEANKLGIPVIGVVDTNCSPEGVDYVIPGNDDAMSAIEYYLECLGEVVKAAQVDLKAHREKVEKRNKPIIKKAAVKTKEVVEKADTEEVKVEAKTEKVVKKVVKRVAKASKTPVVEDVSEEKPAKKVAAKKATTVKKTVAKKAPAKKKAEPKAKASSKASTKE